MIVQSENWLHIQIKQTNLYKNKLSPKHSWKSQLTKAPGTCLTCYRPRRNSGWCFVWQTFRMAVSSTPECSADYLGNGLSACSDGGKGPGQCWMCVVQPRGPQEQQRERLTSHRETRTEESRWWLPSFQVGSLFHLSIAGIFVSHWCFHPTSIFLVLIIQISQSSKPL